MASANPAQNNGPTPAQQKARSPSYPSDGLETCYKWAQKIYKAERRNTTSTLVAVKHMGYSSLSGAARTGLSAMKKFGLLVQEGGEKVRVSDEAVKLFLDPDDESRVALLRVMAQKPEIIKEILNQHAEGLPSEESLRFKLITDRGFGHEAANTFIRALHETVRFAKLTPGSYGEAPPEDPGAERMEQPEIASTNAGATAVPAAAPARGPGSLHVWSLGGGVTVELRSSAPLTSKHFKRLSRYVELAAEAEEDDVSADD